MPNSIIQKLLSEKKFCKNLPTFVAQAKGNKPNKNQIASQSNFSEPLNPNNLGGNSRIWADAKDEVKLKSINQIISEALKQKLNLHEASFALGVTFIESGFNPDAAATTTSASGLGQFIDKTGAAYNLDDNNRFNIIDNARALISQLKQDLLKSKRNNTDQEAVFVDAYAYYHDGSFITEETRDFSQNRIPKLVEEFSNYLESEDCLGRFLR